MKLSGARIVLECIKREGVDLIFGLPGGAVLPIYDALYDFEGLRHVLVRQEAAAGHAAEGYARTTGKVGVCLVTSGPGRDQPGHRAAGRPDGLDPDRGLHRAGADHLDRQRRVPGGRQRRHHPLGHQAQLPGEGRQGPGPDHQGGVSHRRHRAPGAGPRGPAEGHPGQGVELRVSRSACTCARTTRRTRAIPGRSRRRPARWCGPSGRSSTWAAARSPRTPRPSCGSSRT